MRVPKFLLPAPKKLDFGPKNWHFGPNIGIFGPFDLRPDQKTMRTNCLGGFCYVGTKTFTYSHKNQDFWPKNGQIWSKICIFGHFGPNIAIFCTFCLIPDQKTIWTRCLGGFSVMWVTKLLISPVKKTTKFGPKLAFLVNLGQAMQAYSVPCWWVGCRLWRAGCISQDTYLLYCNLMSPGTSSLSYRFFSYPWCLS